MYPIPTLHTKRPLGLRRSYVLIFTLGMVLGDPWGSRASYVHFFEIKIGSELALVGRSGDASRWALGPQRSGDAASSIRAREAEAALHAASLQAEHFLSAYVVPGSM